MTKRYGWLDDPYSEEAPDFAEYSRGDFVHYSDYSRLIEALRTIREFSASPTLSKEVAEAALLSAGEEL